MLGHLRNGLAVLAFAAISLAALPTTAPAAYPDRPITLVVPFAPGGFTDIVARLVGDKLSKELGQPVVVENRTGAGGNVAAGMVARAQRDGYTLFVSTITTHGINPTLYGTLPYDPVKDFTPITLLVATPNVLVAAPSLPVKSVSDLIALAKSKLGKLNMGSTGVGSSPHLQGELLKSAVGIDMVHVPYRGSSQAVIDLMAGTIDVMFDNSFFQRPYIESGKVKALAITSSERSPLLPDVPTMRELGIEGFDFGPWFAISTPSGIPADVAAKLNTSINAILKMPDVQEKLKGAVILGGSSEHFGKFAEAEMKKWGELIKKLGITAQ